MRDATFWRCIIPGMLVVVVASPSRADDPTTLEARARPILARCVACHSGEKPKGGLDLTTRENALAGGKSGEPAFVADDAENSALIAQVDDRLMPPKNPLSAEDAALLRQWVDAGAPWHETIHKDDAATQPDDGGWAFAAIRDPAIPAARNASWPFDPMDSFILDALDAAGLSPSPDADRATWLRRATFDMHGLPPTPEEVAAFVADRSPRAFETVVDRLLASPRYGERWGRHWLDLARFSESHGFEYDRLRENAWRYRDYVIGSLNADMPYNRFVTEQIAGDALTPLTSERIAATGFLVAGPWDEAGNNQQSVVMKARVREEELEDMVAAVGQTFLGLTVNCARCHDHKFDPITQVDYTRIKAALAGVLHGDRPALPPEALDRRDRQRRELNDRIAALETEMAALERSARQSSPSPELPTCIPRPLAWWTFETDARDVLGGLDGSLIGGATVVGGRLRLNGAGQFLSTSPLGVSLKAKTLEAWVVLRRLDQRGGGVISVERPGGSRFDAIVFGENEPRNWSAGSEFFRRTRHFGGPLETAGPQSLVHLVIAYDEDGLIRAYRDGVPLGKPYRPEGESTDPLRFEPNAGHVLIGLRHTGAANGFLDGEIEEARLFDRALSPPEIATLHQLGTRHIDVAEHLDSASRARFAALRAERKTLASLQDGLRADPLVYAANSVVPPPTHLLQRGDVTTPSQIVSAGGLSAVETPSPDLGLTPDAPEMERRRKLAAWITSDENPLTPRVIVNRLWQYHFGVGIVSSPSDFGVNGDRPSHPFLLDHLAGSLLSEGWRLKPIHRRILLSHTYRQSSRFDAAAAEKDADDRLLWRFPPRRLEAEAIHDAMLFASGGLNLRMAGPSARPFTVTTFNSNFYTPFDSPDPDLNRRSVYRMNINSGKAPLMDALDCPDPSVKTPRRGSTTTPLQALGLMNDAFVIRMSHDLAERCRRDAGENAGAQVDRAYALVLGRLPSEDERNAALRLAREHGLDQVTWVLFNATEFLYVR